jgi:hypothetical protein
VSKADLRLMREIPYEPKTLPDPTPYEGIIGQYVHHKIFFENMYEIT